MLGNQRADTVDSGLCTYCAQRLPQSNTYDLSSIVDIPECEASCPNPAYSGQLCTREPGHGGRHVVCGLHFHQIATWEKRDAD